MNLTELKKQSAAELMELALSMNLEGLARNRKQELIFAIVKAHSKQGEDVITTGKSSLECAKLVKRFKSNVLGYACIIDRSNFKS